MGACTGFLAYRAMRAIGNFPVGILIPQALVTGTYALAERSGTSGPLSVVTAEMIIGDTGLRFAMSNRTQSYVPCLWTPIDEVLNSVLFC
jgi:CPA1 family monovalent cation:H+ antiporter